MIADRQLSKRYTLFQLTRTEHADLQAENREVSEQELAKLIEVAELLEQCTDIIGCELLDVHSGRRFYKLNARVGGSPKSQHMLCEAGDCSPVGPDTEATIEAAFAKLAAAVKAGKLKVGQLIIESQADGREGRKFWIHVSLGAPHRELARCGQVLRMKDGKYEVYKENA
jgi:hypothetical protein